ncbi:unnamed protein product [Diplocarpon coronariae]
MAQTRSAEDHDPVVVVVLAYSSGEDTSGDEYPVLESARDDCLEVISFHLALFLDLVLDLFLINSDLDTEAAVLAKVDYGAAWAGDGVVEGITLWSEQSGR